MAGYETALSEIPADVSFGYSSIHVLRPNELSQGQIGYGIDPEGELLWGDAVGDWKKSWLVIGYEGMCGDPIFIDTEASGYPVFTAIHGQGDWNPKLIAVSLDAFGAALSAVALAAKGRDNPAALEKNPISETERDAVLATIRRRNAAADLYFWRLMLDDFSGESDVQNSTVV